MPSRAYKNEIRVLGPSEPSGWAGLGEVETEAAPRAARFHDDAEEGFRPEAVALDPKSPRGARILISASPSEQSGDKTQGGDDLAPSSSRTRRPARRGCRRCRRAYRLELKRRNRARTIRPGPTPGKPSGPDGRAAVAAMDPKDQQQAMIRIAWSMGSPSASRPTAAIIDGWLRLVRAYRVLRRARIRRWGRSVTARRTFAGDPAATKRLAGSRPRTRARRDERQMTRKKKTARRSSARRPLPSSGRRSAISLYCAAGFDRVLLRPERISRRKAPTPGTRLRIGGLVEAGLVQEARGNRDGRSSPSPTPSIDVKVDLHRALAGPVPRRAGRRRRGDGRSRTASSRPIQRARQARRALHAERGRRRPEEVRVCGRRATRRPRQTFQRSARARRR